MDKVFIIIQAITGALTIVISLGSVFILYPLKPLHYPFKPTNDTDKEDRIYELFYNLNYIDSVDFGIHYS